MDEVVALVLASMLAFVFGWNNSSFLIGNARGSGTLTLPQTLLTASVGLLLGVLTEGSKMTHSLVGSIAPAAPSHVLDVTLVISVATAVLFTLLKLPVSFSSTMVGAFVGALVADSLAIHGGALAIVVAFWFVAPVLTAPLAFVIYYVLRALSDRMNIVSVDTLNRVGVVVSCVAIAYVLGANNVGLIEGAAQLDSGQTFGLAPVLVVTASAILGMLVFGKGSVSATVGDRLMSLSPAGVFSTFIGSSISVWAGTQFGLPISITQCLLGGMFGASFTKKVHVLNDRLALETILSWAVFPAAAFVAAWVLATLWH